MSSLNDIKNALQNEVNKNKPKKKEKVSYTQGLMKSAIGQGLMFGYGDEARAKVQSLIKGTKYEDEVKKEREQLASFRESNPISAYGSEIAGAVLPSVATGGASLLARAGIKGAGKVGALQGAVYGSGVGEDAESRLKGAVGGAVIGGTVGKVAGAILPKTTELARKMLNKGIRITAGQGVKGSGALGNLAYGLEASSTSIPGVGSAISQAKTQAISDFNKYAMLEAIEPILNDNSRQIIQNRLKNLNGNEAFDVVDDFVSKEYSKVLPKLKIEGGKLLDLQDSLMNVVNKADIDAKAKDLIFNKLQRDFLSKTEISKSGVKFISGKNLKKLEETLTADMNNFIRKGGFDTYIGFAFNDLRKTLRKSIQLNNPKSNLQKINLAFAQLNPIGEAVSSANKTQGIFSTAQFLNAIKKVDKSIRKKVTKTGKNLMLGLAREGDEMFGDFVPDSGTASRLIAGQSAISPAVASKYILPTIGSQAIYGLGRGATRGLLNIPSLVSRGAGRVASGLLGEQAFNVPQQTAQNIGESGGLINKFR